MPHVSSRHFATLPRVVLYFVDCSRRSRIRSAYTDGCSTKVWSARMQRGLINARGIQWRVVNRELFSTTRHTNAEAASTLSPKNYPSYNQLSTQIKSTTTTNEATANILRSFDSSIRVTRSTNRQRNNRHLFTLINFTQHNDL